MQSIGQFSIYKLNKKTKEKELLRTANNKVSIDLLRILLGLNDNENYNAKFTLRDSVNLKFNINYRPQVNDILQKNIFNRLSFVTLYMNNTEYNNAYNKLNDLKFESNDLTGWGGIDNYVSDLRYIPKAECSYFDDSLNKYVQIPKLYENIRYGSYDNYSIYFPYSLVAPYKLPKKYLFSAKYTVSGNVGQTNKFNAIALRYAHNYNINLNLAKFDDITITTGDVIFIYYQILLNFDTNNTEINFNNNKIKFNYINNSLYRAKLNYSCLYNFRINSKYINDDDFSKYTDDRLYNSYYLPLWPIEEVHNYAGIIKSRNDMHKLLLNNNSFSPVNNIISSSSNAYNYYFFKNSITKVTNISMSMPKIKDMEIYYSINNDKKYELDVNKKNKYYKCTMEDFFYWKSSDKKLPGVVIRNVNISKDDSEINTIKFFVKQQISLLEEYDDSSLSPNLSQMDEFGKDENIVIHDVFFEYTFLPILSFETPYVVSGTQETLPIFYHGFETDDTRNI
jgi:hypothetical protein